MPVDEEKNPLPAELEAKVGEVLDKLPPEQERVVRRAILQVAKHHSGPLPDPESLAAYDKIIKDGAERMMRMVEQEQAHRHSLEESVVAEQVKFGFRGQLIGALLTILLSAGAIYLGINSHDTLAGIIAATTIVGVVAVFVTGQRTVPSEPEESEPRPKQPGKIDPPRGKRK